MARKLAIEGGAPVREDLLPYGRQSVDDEDVAAVVDVLRSDWLTTGPTVGEFEGNLATFVGSRCAVAVNSGTAALHAAVEALGIGAGDEVIVPTMSFVASANCVRYTGAAPVLADVDPDSLLITPTEVDRRVTPHTRAVVAVDLTGHACDYDGLRKVADRHGLAIIADSCHALGGTYKGRAVGSLGDLSTFSFHPVKPITAGEGGAVTTDIPDIADRIRMFRNHGLSSDHRQRQSDGSWYYEMLDLGYNYRLTDIQCALGLSQIRKLPQMVARRRAIAKSYDAAFAERPDIDPLPVSDDVEHGYHIYVVRLRLERLRVDRATVFAALRAEGIGVNVHYIPIHLHPYYRKVLGTNKGDFPRAEEAYERILTLPLFPTMSDGDVTSVVEAVEKTLDAYAR